MEGKEARTSFKLYWWQYSLISLELAIIGVVVLVKRKDMQILIVSELRIFLNIK
jgi:hypothetical protein